MWCAPQPTCDPNAFCGDSAKYIEGLENRLARMESLLRLSGMLSEEDEGRTDLGTLEKRLADRSRSTGSSPAEASHQPESVAGQSSAESQHATPAARNGSTVSVHSNAVTPEPASKESREEVEALSDMMCSLVTNNCGETRYIGEQEVLAMLV